MVHDIMGLMNMMGQLKSNPMALLSRRFSIPTNISNPQDIVQHLLNTGQVSQAQVNQAMKMRNDPNIMGLFR